MKKNAIVSYVLLLALLSCHEDESPAEAVKICPSDLVPGSNWAKLETRIIDPFFEIQFSLCEGDANPSDDFYCLSARSRARMWIHIESSRIKPGAVIELSNGVPPVGNKPPLDGSYIEYEHFTDDPGNRWFFYDIGYITITDIIDDKIFGTVVATSQEVDGIIGKLDFELKGVPFYATTIACD